MFKRKARSRKVTSELPEVEKVIGIPGKLSVLDAANTYFEDNQEQKWPGALISKDKLLVPIKAKEKISDSSNDFFAFPDIALDGFHIKEGRALLASVRGDMKRHLGGLRQDSAIVDLISFNDDSKYVRLILADGVGSKKMSHLASRAVVVSCRESAISITPPTRDNWARSSEQIFENAVRAIEDLGKASSILNTDLLTTLTVAFIRLDNAEMQTIYVASVGNCRSLAMIDRKLVELENREKTNDLVASAKTKALPINVSDLQISIVDLPKNAICCVLSDGAVEVVNQGLDFASLLHSQDLDVHMLGWAIDVRASGRTDDRTIVIWRPW